MGKDILYYNEDFLEGPAVIFKGMPYTIKKIDSDLLIAEGVASFSDMTIKIMNKSQTNLFIVDHIHEKKIYFCQDSWATITLHFKRKFIKLVIKITMFN